MPAEPVFDDRGLVPCIVQDADVGTVLMIAWKNAEALELTRSTGVVHFWSRSRQALWKKGETSGNTLAVVELRLDCDADAILARVQPAGPTCHTGAISCFGAAPHNLDDGGLPPDGSAAEGRGSIDAPTATIIDRLARTLAARRDSATGEKSYTKSLLDAGMPKILAKIAEEHGELAAELPTGADADVIHEAADLLFHVMVGLTAREIPIESVLRELARRFGTSGHVEKASRS